MRAASERARAGSAAWCSACDSSATSTLASRSGSFSSSPRFQITLRTRRRVARPRARSSTTARPIDGNHARRPAAGFDRQVALAAAQDRRRATAAAGGPAPGPRPPSSGRARADAPWYPARRARRSSPCAAGALPPAARRRPVPRRSGRTPRSAHEGRARARPRRCQPSRQARPGSR